LIHVNSSAPCGRLPLELVELICNGIVNRNAASPLTRELNDRRAGRRYFSFVRDQADSALSYAAAHALSHQHQPFTASSEKPATFL
jgi:hypothetical protein